jgi:hypothetical protein
VIAKPPAIRDGATQRTLSYTPARPLLVTDRAVIAVWAEPSASGTEVAVYAQWSPLR